jgi:hypothetical protein
MLYKKERGQLSVVKHRLYAKSFSDDHYNHCTVYDRKDLDEVEMSPGFLKWCG